MASTSPSAPPKLSGLVEQSPSALKPWPNNARTHSPKQLFRLKKSIERFGFTIPLLVDEHGTILAGEARWRVAQEQGLEAIPTRVLSGLSTAEKRAYVIGDNKLALLSGWDLDLLRDEIRLLVEEDFEVDLTGFSTVEIDLLLDQPGTEGEVQPVDVAPEVISRRGDLWQLGEHRLLCGDALDEASYSALLGADRAQMAITDPPYNVRIDGHAGGLGKIKHAEFPMACGEMSAEKFTAFLGTAFTWVSSFSVDGAISFVCMDWRHQRELLDAARPMFGDPKQLIVWVKDNAGMGTFYRSQHELILVFKKGTASHINNFELGQHGRYRTNVWEYPSINSGRGRKLLALHPTVKPVAMIADAIRDCSHRGGLVLDPFAGSGTVLVAAERTGRRARAIELDPLYVDVGIRRWQRVSGKQVVLNATGRTWEQVRAERLADSRQVSSAKVGHGL